ncbi:flavin reductase family protein [Actinoplanes awajinensis]|uniref:Flavin reductase n=1 Tax=Actinoplanes awajinensis subsp. mycoplanecinus TaxID=135947 RepID=A0A0X3VBA8_9ACTN|nr:flavin reductase family protein [Actinoplanes awajinensis]KUL41542.1 flavin reductase [Actinoplanes awajinensis subsp. mycoplanecinus]
MNTPPFDALALRQAFGTFATGVTVVTVGGPTPHGMTANSFTAVSLDPPLLLVCIEHNAVMHEALRSAGRFGVSVLAAGHAPLARYFADRRRPLGGEQFGPVDWQAGEHTGAPLITGALAHFECGLWRSYDGGDHTIFLGRLLGMGSGAEDEALLFHRGRISAAHRSEVAA